MLMGAVCTRACRFCAVDTGNPNQWLDADEPENTAKTVSLMNLEYVVLTSVNRDDLSDGGAAHYANTILAIKKSSPNTKIEALTPDFQGAHAAISRLLDSGVDVFAQNVETVKRLTHEVRDKRAGYEQTLEVLKYAKAYRPDVLTKTSLMLGLGETLDEIIAIFDQRMTHDVRDLQEKPFGKIFFDESFHVDLSSTQLREQLHLDRTKENLMSALSPNVLECIFAQNIYASFN
jgi:lipoic acid synthetase